MPRGIRSNFEYHVPADLGQALEMLKQYGPDARVIAGGTDLLPKVKAGVVEFGHLVSLKELKELTAVGFDGSGALHIGATARLGELERIPALRERYPALWEGIHSMANTQIRNRGTVTGNICNAVPSCDTAPALLVYDASVAVRSADGERTVPIGEFFTGVCRTCLKPEELVTEIILPPNDPHAVSVYYKYAIRKALDLAMVGVGSNVLLEDGAVKDARLALGAVAIVPKRAFHAEEAILGRQLTPELIEQAARIASQDDCRPISDIRATADYRREMVRLLVRDALKLAAGIKIEGLNDEAEN